MAAECKVLDYSVGAYPMEDGYFKPVNSMVPIRYTPTYGLRKINVTLEVVADTPKEAVDMLNLYHGIYTTWNEIDLKDGYKYYVVLDSLGDPKMHSQRILQQTFNFVGFRYTEKVEQTIEVNGRAEITLETGAFPCDVVFRIDKLSLDTESIEVTVNGITVKNITYGAIIDGLSKKVIDFDGNNKFGDTNLIEFPKFNAVKDVLTVVGTCSLTVSYYKIAF